MVERAIVLLTFFVLCVLDANAQKHYRMRTHVETKTVEDSIVLSEESADIYYDINHNVVITRFEGLEIVQTLSDEKLTLYKNNKKVSQVAAKGMKQQNVICLAVDGLLPDMGLSKSAFLPVSVVKKNTNTLVTYRLTNNVLDTVTSNNTIVEIIVSYSLNKTDALAAYAKDGKIILKQYFVDYKNYDGINFPTKIIQAVANESGKQIYIKQTFSNIIVDEQDNNDSYFFVGN